MVLIAALFSLYQMNTKDRANMMGPIINPIIDAPS
jgi:hypothetical protein